MKKIYPLLLIITLLHCKSKEDPLFVSKVPAETGVAFANNLSYGDSLSVIDFEYMYNGGGVAVGDINNDGWQDLFFTGNMTPSKLYLNKGGWKFEDITERAGINTRTWASGVALVDINQDGFKDIYISVGGNRNTPESERENLLFINNGDLTFTEKAKSYGLNDNGYGIQSTFFDYDLDGDLDMYLLRNSFVSYSRNASRPKLVNGEAASNDKLFRNNGDLTFTDVTKEAGILIEGFGLGVCVSDINEDGWPDIYVSNDFITNDLMWINNQDGTFSNQVRKYIKHQTFNGMGNDVADYNNDGLIDIVVVDMLPEDNLRWKLTPRGNGYDEFQNGLSLGYEPQYVRNTLQLNNGNGTFSEIGQLAGMEATEWSWSALLADYDNDGWKDLFISNGYGKDITNLDFIMYGDDSNNMGLPEVTKQERQAALNELPGIKIHNYMYRNNKDLTFSDVSDSWGLSEPTFSNGSAYADLDNDGDLDLVTNNIDGPATLLESQSIKENSSVHYLRVTFKGPAGNKEGFGAKVYLTSGQTKQYQYFTPFRGYLSSVEPFLHFGLGDQTKVETLEVVWPDGRNQILKNVPVDQVLQVSYQEATSNHDYNKEEPITPLLSENKDSGIDFVHKENSFVDFKVQPTLPHMFSRTGPGIAVGDVNGDGLEDCYIAGAANSSGVLYIQEKSGTFSRKRLNARDTISEETGVSFFDADKDDDSDLYLASGGSEADSSRFYQDHLLLNDGTGKFSESVDLPTEESSSSCVAGSDYDQDGDIDVFVGGRVSPGKYPMPASSFLLINESGSGKIKFTKDEKSVQGEMVCAALWSDYDSDGWTDLIVAGEFMPIQFYKNKNGKLDAPFELENSSGWWNSITATDFDLDGDIDYVAGNLGLNSHFKATVEEPLCIYAKDFNTDGRIDPLTTYYTQGVKYIGHPRDVLIDQINTMKRRFRTFSDYANATFEDSFRPEELKDAYVICAQTFENTYIENLGNGKFKTRPLPLPAQIAPINGMIADDFDEDGNPDLLLSGNSYSPEVLSGRDDAMIGLLLKGDGKGNFVLTSPNQSGFLSDGDSRGLVKIIRADGKPLILVANNDSKVKVFEQQVSKHFSAGPSDAYALVTLKDGRTFKHEFYYGSTYLSSTSRSLRITSSVKSVKVVDNSGKSRNIELK